MNSNIHHELAETLAEFSGDSVGFVMWAFPWGEPGELADAAGPDEWQLWVLSSLDEGLLTIDEAIQIAVASGHGIGKSALVAWVILWALSTMVDARGVVTANTERQLKTKTWVELAKWFRLFIARDLFHFAKTSVYSRDPEHSETWRVDMIPWSENNAEAFAGLHNYGRRIFVIFDEASTIADVIWETTEGALTDEDTEIIWLCFGNPTSNKGRFRQCFDNGQFAHRWLHRQIDSRTVKISNKRQLEKWIDDYGEDHDFTRVRVRGMFPRVDASAFIGYDDALDAARRKLDEPVAAPVLLGVDVARFGDDRSVIYPRRGLDGRSIPVRVYSKIPTTELARHVEQAFYELRAQAIFVDEGGVGGGVVDMLEEKGLPVFGVSFGSKADGWTGRTRGEKYANKRAEIWGAMRAWLKRGIIPESVEDGHNFVDELATPTYTFNNSDEIVLERKADIKRRGEPSPDFADALACTFAHPFADNLVPRQKQLQNHQTSDYDPYKEFEHESS